jgi:hypothetical protein
MLFPLHCLVLLFLALANHRFRQAAFASCGAVQLLRDLSPVVLVAAAEAGEHDF